MATYSQEALRKAYSQYKSGANITDMLASRVDNYSSADSRYTDEKLGALSDFFNYLQQLDVMDRNADLTRQFRDYDNQYNSPAAQVARLMQTGMSREAALQAISAAPSQANVIGMQADPTTAVSGSQEAANYAQAFSSYVNSGLNIATLGMQAAQFGLSLPQIRSANDVAGVQSWIAQQTQSGYQTSNDLMNLASRARESGAIPLDSEAWQSLPQLIDGMRSVANSALDPITDNSGLSDFKRAAKNYFSSDSWMNYNRNPFAKQNAESMFNSQWGTAGLKNTPQQIDRLIRQQIADTSVRELQPHMTVQSMLNLIATADQSYAYADEARARTNVDNAQVHLLEAQTNLTDVQMLGQLSANELINEQAHYYSDIRPSLTAATLAEYGQRAMYCSQMDEQTAKVLWDSYVTTERGKAADAFFRILQSEHRSDIFEAHPWLYTWDVMRNNSPFGEVLDVGESVVKTGAGAAIGAGVLKTAVPGLAPSHTSTVSSPIDLLYNTNR